MLKHNVAKHEIRNMIKPLTEKYIKTCKKEKIPITKKGWIEFLGVHRSTLNEWRKYSPVIKAGVEEAIKMIDKEDRKTTKALAAKKEGYKLNKNGKLTKTGFTREEIDNDMEKRLKYYSLLKERKEQGKYDLTNEKNVEEAVDVFFANLITEKEVYNKKTEQYEVETSVEIPTLPLLALHLGISTNQLKRYSRDAPGGDIVTYAKQVIEAESMQSLVNAKGSFVGIMFAMKNGFDYIDKVTQQLTDEKTEIQKLTDEELERELAKYRDEEEGSGKKEAISFEEGK